MAWAGRRISLIGHVAVLDGLGGILWAGKRAEAEAEAEERRIVCGKYGMGCLRRYIRADAMGGRDENASGEC